MNHTLVRSAAVLVPVAALFVYAVAAAANRRTVGSAVQLAGAACLIVVVFTHIAEALALFPSMRWGQPASIGHYVDLSSAILGLMLVPVGYLLDRRSSAGRRDR